MSKKKLAFLFVCAATVMACNESVEWNADNACQDGKKTCSGDAVMVCKDGTYTEEQKCSGSTPVCKVDGDSASCVAGETPKPTCTPGCNGNTLVTCDAAGNKTETPCTGDTPVCGKNVIGIDACIAASTVTCTPGCSGNILVTCDADGNKTETPCTGDTPACGKDGDGNDACIAASTETCTPGCDGDTLVVCTEDGAVDEDKTVDCTETDQICGQDGDGNDACVDDLSNVKCTYGEGEDAIELEVDDIVCDENGKKLTCKDDGTISEPTDCDAGKVCRADSEESPVGGCVDYKSCTIGEGEDATTLNHGEKMCDADKNILACNDGEVEKVECTAPEVCTDTEGTLSCKEPAATDCDNNGTNVSENTKICKADGSQIQVCKGGQFEDVTEGACTAEVQGCFVIEGTPTCRDLCSASVCSVTDGTANTRICTEYGYYEDLAACSGIDKATTYGCKDDTTCIATECDEGYHPAVDYSKCEEDCKADVCKDGKLQACYFGTLTEPEDCIETFNSTANAKTAKCNTEGNACVIETCADGFALTTEGKCEPSNDCTYEGNKISSGDYYCISETRVGVCNTGTFTEFTAAQMQTVLPQCAAGYKCDSATINMEYDCTIAPACTKDVCADGKIKKCNSGTLADEVACSGITDATTYGCNTAGDACVATACSGDKVPSADGLSCVENTTSACSYGGVEVAHGDLGCKSDTTLSMCDNGAWDSEADETCILGCNVSGKECTKCTASAIICEGALAILCVADTKPAASDTQTCKDASHCIAGEGCVECINNDDCAAVEGKSACDTATYKCVPKKCTDAVSSESVDGDGSIGCMSETKYSVCKNGVWSTVESDIIDCAEESKVCDPASTDCKAGSEPEWAPINTPPADFTACATEGGACACGDNYLQNLEYKSSKCQTVGVASTPVSVNSNAGTRYADGHYIILASNSESVATHNDIATITKYMQLSLTSAENALLSGKTKVRASFTWNAKSEQYKYIGVVFLDGTTVIGTDYVKNENGSTAKDVEFVTKDIDLPTTLETGLNVRVFGYALNSDSVSSFTQQLKFKPITIEAK